VIRFNVGYIGTWGATDALQLEVNDGYNSSFYNWEYIGCGLCTAANNSSIPCTQNLCSIQGTDCVKIKEFKIQHNASYLTLKWTSLTTQNDPNIQNWGIKDHSITAKTCHRYCNQCFGEKVSECYTCSAGYFLSGNTCVSKCPNLAILNTNNCVDACPVGYYHNPLNNYCESCISGCSFCSGSNNCLLWENGSNNSGDDTWSKNIAVWVVMIVGGVGIIGLLLWKFIIKKYLIKE
jgi:hypothetical protein